VGSLTNPLMEPQVACARALGAYKQTDVKPIRTSIRLFFIDDLLKIEAEPYV
jgi:hypothetical protein